MEMGISGGYWCVSFDRNMQLDIFPKEEMVIEQGKTKRLG